MVPHAMRRQHGDQGSKVTHKRFRATYEALRGGGLWGVGHNAAAMLERLEKRSAGARYVPSNRSAVIARA